MRFLDEQDIGLLILLGFLSVFWIAIGLGTLYNIPLAKDILMGSAIALGSFFILVISVTILDEYRYRDFK